MILDGPILHYTVDESGTPHPCPDVIAHAQWMTQQALDDDFGLRRVALTEFAEGGYVSTVFLGCDMGLFGEPVLWETMVFPDHEWQQRYTSQDAALAGHDRIVKLEIAKRGTSRQIIRDVRRLPATARR